MEYVVVEVACTSEKMESFFVPISVLNLGLKFDFTCVIEADIGLQGSRFHPIRHVEGLFPELLTELAIVRFVLSFHHF